MTGTAAADGSLLLVGCGNMGGAMLSRWLATGLDPARVTVVSPSGRALPEGVRSVRSAAEAGGSVDTLLLALKPQQLGAIAADLARLRPRRVVSILAGVELATLAALLPDGTGVVRAMPNLPVALGRGVVALHGGAAERAAVETLMAPLGLVEWIDDEALFDAVTAVAGCGPAFAFRFVDALAEAGTALGLPADQALRLAAATVAGAGVMAEAADVTPDILADRVASRGGATRAGLDVLDREGALSRIVAEAVGAARARSRAMADEARRR